MESNQKNLSPRSRVRVKRQGAQRPWQEATHGPSESQKRVEHEFEKDPPAELQFPNLPYIAKAIATFGRIYNGFESSGDTHIPLRGPAIIVFYHGLVPLDAWYFGLQFYLKTGRLIRGLGDRWLFRTPGFKHLVESVGGIEGNPDIAYQLLSEGHVIGVSPGGVREAIKGTSESYKLKWNNRLGFAKLALKAKVPIIPAFSENVEELYRAPLAGHPFFQTLYEKTRWPIVPIVGLGLLPFPVKVKTWIGEPIPYDPKDSPEVLAEKTRLALEALIQRHQKQRKQTIADAVKKRFLDTK